MWIPVRSLPFPACQGTRPDRARAAAFGSKSLPAFASPPPPLSLALPPSGAAGSASNKGHLPTPSWISLSSLCAAALSCGSSRGGEQQLCRKLSNPLDHGVPGLWCQAGGSPWRWARAGGSHLPALLLRLSPSSHAPSFEAGRGVRASFCAPPRPFCLCVFLWRC